MKVQHFFYLGYMCVFLKEIREAYVNSMILSWLLRQLILGILMPFTYFIDNEEDFFSLLDKEQDTKKEETRSTMVITQYCLPWKPIKNSREYFRIHFHT